MKLVDIDTFHFSDKASEVPEFEALDPTKAADEGHTKWIPPVSIGNDDEDDRTPPMEFDDGADNPEALGILVALLLPAVQKAEAFPEQLFDQFLFSEPLLASEIAEDSAENAGFAGAADDIEVLSDAPGLVPMQNPAVEFAPDPGGEPLQEMTTHDELWII